MAESNSNSLSAVVEALDKLINLKHRENLSLISVEPYSDKYPNFAAFINAIQMATSHLKLTDDEFITIVQNKLIGNDYSLAEIYLKERKAENKPLAKGEFITKLGELITGTSTELLYKNVTLNQVDVVNFDFKDYSTRKYLAVDRLYSELSTKLKLTQVALNALPQVRAHLLPLINDGSVSTFYHFLDEGRKCTHKLQSRGIVNTFYDSETNFQNYVNQPNHGVYNSNNNPYIRRQSPNRYFNNNQNSNQNNNQNNYRNYRSQTYNNTQPKQVTFDPKPAIISAEHNELLKQKSASEIDEFIRNERATQAQNSNSNFIGMIDSDSSEFESTTPESDSESEGDEKRLIHLITALVKQELLKQKSINTTTTEDDTNTDCLKVENERFKQEIKSLPVTKPLYKHKCTLLDTAVDIVIDTAAVTTMITKDLVNKLNLTQHHYSDLKRSQKNFSGLGTQICLKEQDIFCVIELQLPLADGTFVKTKGIAHPIDKISQKEDFDILLGKNFHIPALLHMETNQLYPLEQLANKSTLNTEVLMLDEPLDETYIQYAKYVTDLRSPYKTYLYSSKHPEGYIGLKWVYKANDKIFKITNVKFNSVASRAKLKKGDVILKINDVSTTDMDMSQFIAELKKVRAQPVKLIILRELDYYLYLDAGFKPTAELIGEFKLPRTIGPHTDTPKLVRCQANTDNLVKLLQHMRTINTLEIFTINEYADNNYGIFAQQNYNKNRDKLETISIDEKEIKIGKELTPEQKQRLTHLIHYHKINSYTLNGDPITTTNVLTMNINTGDHSPIALSPYKANAEKRRIIRKQCEDYLAAGMIEHAYSDWAFPVTLVSKKTGDHRMVIDYRKLNAITVKDTFPIPNIDDILTFIKGANFFTSLDMKQSYHQILIKPADRKKTCFITNEATYQWKVMSFGLCNAPSVFMRLMVHVFKDLINEKILVYLDDILIFSTEFTDHLNTLNEVIYRLTRHRLKLNLTKCLFALTEVTYLGYTINKNGLTPELDKLKVVREFPRPHNVKSLQSFLGLTNYYRKFIPEFSVISQPLIRLLKKDEPFVWNTQQEAAYLLLKNELCKSPVLKLYDPDAPIKIHTDASKLAVAAILYQLGLQDAWHPVCYASRTLTSAERNYSATDLETLAVMFAIKKFEQYIIGKKFKIITDHRALIFLKENLNQLSARNIRWLNKIQMYDFTIEYKKGTKHTDVDALSRYVPETDLSLVESCDVNEILVLEEIDYNVSKNRLRRMVRTIVNRMNDQVALVLSERNESIENELEKREKIALFKEQLVDYMLEKLEEREICEMFIIDEVIGITSNRFKRHQNKDPFCSEKIRLLKLRENNEGMTKKEKRLINNYAIYNHILYNIKQVTGTDFHHTYVVPKTLVQEVIKIYHESPISGHPGMVKTLQNIADKYYWPNMSKDIKQYITNCHVCQICNLKNKKHAPLQDMQISRPLELMAIDFMGPYKDSKGKLRYILLIIDYFTKYVEGALVRDTSAKTTIKFLKDHVFFRHGTPERILSDNGPPFMSSEYETFLKSLGSFVVKTTTYNPSSNGEIERTNRTIKSYLTKLTTDPNYNKWEDNIQLAIHCYNTCVHKSTGYTPYYLMHSRQCNKPLDVLLDLNIHMGPTNSYNEYVYSIERNYLIATNAALYQNSISKAQYKNYHDKRYTHSEFVPGDKVIIKKAKTGSFQPYYSTPYVVTHRYSPCLYGIQSTETGRSDKVHITKMQRYNENNVATASRNTDGQILMLTESEEKLANQLVKKIVKKVKETPKQLRPRKRVAKRVNNNAKIVELLTQMKEQNSQMLEYLKKLNNNRLPVRQEPCDIVGTALETTNRLPVFRHLTDKSPEVEKIQQIVHETINAVRNETANLNLPVQSNVPKTNPIQNRIVTELTTSPPNPVEVINNLPGPAIRNSSQNLTRVISRNPSVLNAQPINDNIPEVTTSPIIPTTTAVEPTNTAVQTPASLTNNRLVTASQLNMVPEGYNTPNHTQFIENRTENAALTTALPICMITTTPSNTTLTATSSNVSRYPSNTQLISNRRSTEKTHVLFVNFQRRHNDDVYGNMHNKEIFSIVNCLRNAYVAKSIMTNRIKTCLKSEVRIVDHFLYVCIKNTSKKDSLTTRIGDYYDIEEYHESHGFWGTQICPNASSERTGYIDVLSVVPILENIYESLNIPPVYSLPAIAGQNVVRPSLSDSLS